MATTSVRASLAGGGDHPAALAAAGRREGRLRGMLAAAPATGGAASSLSSVLLHVPLASELYGIRTHIRPPPVYAWKLVPQAARATRRHASSSGNPPASPACSSLPRNSTTSTSPTIAVPTTCSIYLCVHATGQRQYQRRRHTMTAGRRRPRGRDATGDMAPLGGLRATVSDVVGRGTGRGTATTNWVEWACDK